MILRILITVAMLFALLECVKAEGNEILRNPPLVVNGEWLTINH